MNMDPMQAGRGLRSSGFLPVRRACPKFTKKRHFSRIRHLFCLLMFTVATEAMMLAQMGMLPQTGS